MEYYVYIITNKNDTVLYVGVTNNIIKGIYEHKSKQADGFSNSYNLNKLVYYEILKDPKSAIKREKQIKNWHREWKENAISKFNPGWYDLYEKII